MTCINNLMDYKQNFDFLARKSKFLDFFFPRKVIFLVVVEGISFWILSLKKGWVIITVTYFDLNWFLLMANLTRPNKEKSRSNLT